MAICIVDLDACDIDARRASTRQFLLPLSGPDAMRG